MRSGSTGRTGVAGSRRWTPGEARRALGELARSGMSAEQFARSKGCSSQRFVYWKKRLADSAVEPIAFVSVPLSMQATARSGGPLSRADIEIVVRDVVLRVREDIDVERLARIVDALTHGAR
jgi:hypothetical protein